ncbi:MAG: hypothetical protein ACE5KT_09700 [Methanosarcinales archaeon]
MKEEISNFFLDLEIRREKEAKEKIKEILEEDEEARNHRVKEVDWDFVFSPSSKVARALIELVVTGDLLRCARIAKMSPLEFDKLREEAKIFHL